jgi:hypothetical protein
MSSNSETKVREPPYDAHDLASAICWMAKKRFGQHELHLSFEEDIEDLLDGQRFELPRKAWWKFWKPKIKIIEFDETDYEGKEWFDILEATATVIPDYANDKDAADIQRIYLGIEAKD